MTKYGKKKRKEREREREREISRRSATVPTCHELFRATLDLLGRGGGGERETKKKQYGRETPRIDCNVQRSKCHLRSSENLSTWNHATPDCFETRPFRVNCEILISRQFPDDQMKMFKIRNVEIEQGSAR